jgi:hypothetical protein
MTEPSEVETKKNSFKTTLSLILVAFGLHMSVMFSFLNYKNIILLMAIHGFLILFLVVSNFILTKVKSIDEKKVGMTFLALTLFKMIFSIGFLLLLFNIFDCERKIIIFNFFAPFFIYLLFEVINSLNQLR